MSAYAGPLAMFVVALAVLLVSFRCQRQATKLTRQANEALDRYIRRKEQAEPPTPRLIDGMTLVPCALTQDGWLHVPHADGNWITAAQLSAFNQAVVRHWRIETADARASAGSQDNSHGGL